MVLETQLQETNKKNVTLNNVVDSIQTIVGDMRNEVNTLHCNNQFLRYSGEIGSLFVHQ